MKENIFLEFKQYSKIKYLNINKKDLSYLFKLSLKM